MGQDQAKLLQTGLSNYENKNYSEALSNFRALGDHAESLFMIGEHYFNGFGVPEQDHKQALEYYLKAYNLGYPKAAKKIADIYFNGYGTVAKDSKEAFKYYASSYGYIQEPEIGIKLGNMAYNGEGTKKDYETAFKLFNEQYSIKSVSDDIIFKLGVMYLEGNGVEKNSEEGIKLLNIAHNNGYSEASHKLCDLIIDIEGAFKNKKVNKLNYYSETHEKAFDGMTWYNSYLSLEDAIDKDKKEEAKKYLEAAAIKNDINACYKLGIMLSISIEKSEDCKIGSEYIKKAFDNGHAEAAFVLGVTSYFKQTPDSKLSLEYFTKAAERGCVEGFYMIGWLKSKEIPDTHPIDASFAAIDYYEMAVKKGRMLNADIIKPFAALEKVLNGIIRIIQMANKGCICAMFYLAESYYKIDCEMQVEDNFKWSIKLYKEKRFGAEFINYKFKKMRKLKARIFDMYYEEFKAMSQTDFEMAKKDFERKARGIVPKSVIHIIIDLTEKSLKITTPIVHAL